MRLFLNDSPSSIDEICQTLKISKKDIPFHAKKRNFKRLGFEGRRDPQNGKPIIPRGHGILCTITVSMEDGSTSKVTFAENARPESRHGVSRMKYTPMSIDLPGLQLSLTQDQKNLFFFLYIHPDNVQSPFNLGKQNPHVIYEFEDSEKAAREKDDFEDTLLEALQALKNLGNQEIRQIAKGFREEGIDDLTDVQVRNLLRERAKRDPADFLINLGGNEIALEGIIKDAIDKGVITSRTVGTSKIWNLGDKELAITPIGASEIVSIRAEVESDLEFYFPLLQSSIDKNLKASTLKKPEVDRLFENFQGKPKSDAFSPLGADDRKIFQMTKAEEIEADKLRGYYNVDITDPKVHVNRRKAMVDKGPAILEQFERDKAAGKIPADQPAPRVTLPTAETETA